MAESRTGRCRVVLGSLAVVWLGGLAAAFAQPARTAPEPAVLKIELKENANIPRGKIGVALGQAGPSGALLAVGGLSILQPVSVGLFAIDVDDDLRLELSKFVNDGPAKSGSTRGTGLSSFQFRTEGDVQIKVSSPGGVKPYGLIVWAGDEVEPPVPPAVISMAEYEQRHGGSAAPSGALGGVGPVGFMVIGALLAVVALLLIAVLKRGRS